jgi:Mrp family chromosome partitioning ATPase
VKYKLEALVRCTIPDYNSSTDTTNATSSILRHASTPVLVVPANSMMFICAAKGKIEAMIGWRDYVRIVPAVKLG